MTLPSPGECRDCRHARHDAYGNKRNVLCGKHRRPIDWLDGCEEFEQRVKAPRVSPSLRPPVPVPELCWRETPRGQSLFFTDSPHAVERLVPATQGRWRLPDFPGEYSLFEARKRAEVMAVRRWRILHGTKGPLRFGPERYA